MAKRKIKTRSIYVTTEPKWKELKLITDPAEQEIAFKSCEYFVRTEISKAKYMPVVKKWIKEHSSWAEEEIKVILEKKDRQAASISAPAGGLFLWKIEY